MHATPEPRPPSSGSIRLSELFDEALPQVYEYLRSRCGAQELAEELTSATFVQAALTQQASDRELTIGWLMTVARNKLIDHWRREAVAQRVFTLIDGGRVDAVDPWIEVLDHARAHQVLADLRPDHRAALVLRYLDDLSVPECADALSRSIHATESLLARARNAFRSAYEETGGHDD
ncbi:MAG: sigma-70 family RNA polymerase sigma factor [Actinomycetota bacterium]